MVFWRWNSLAGLTSWHRLQILLPIVGAIVGSLPKLRFAFCDAGPTVDSKSCSRCHLNKRSAALPKLTVTENTCSRRKAVRVPTADGHCRKRFTSHGGLAGNGAAKLQRRSRAPVPEGVAADAACGCADATGYACMRTPYINPAAQSMADHEYHAQEKR